MTEFFAFCLRDFWTFAGSVVLLMVIASGATDIVEAIVGGFRK